MAPMPKPVTTRATIMVATFGASTASTMPTTTMLMDTIVSGRRPYRSPNGLNRIAPAAIPKRLPLRTIPRVPGVTPHSSDIGLAANDITAISKPSRMISASAMAIARIWRGVIFDARIPANTSIVDSFVDNAPGAESASSERRHMRWRLSHCGFGCSYVTAWRATAWHPQALPRSSASIAVADCRIRWMKSRMSAPEELSESLDKRSTITTLPSGSCTGTDSCRGS